MVDDRLPAGTFLIALETRLMHLTRNLLSAEEAFNRLGQLRETGCLVVISDKGTSRIFTRDAHVVCALGEGREGQEVLDVSFLDVQASYLWLPGAKPAQETMNVNINSQSLELAIARDIHLSKTARVKLDSVDQSSTPPPKRSAGYFFLVGDRPGERITLNKSAVVVGRDESSDLVFPHPKISRRHCLIQLTARGLGFKDLESANGVFVNGIRAKDGFLHAGDKLALADYEIFVQRDSKS